MKKTFVIFLFGIYSFFSIGSIFADAGEIQNTDGTAYDTVAKETITAKENGASSSSTTGKLKFPSKDKYDSIIKENVISKTIGEKKGIKEAATNILNPTEGKALIDVVNYVIAAIALIWLVVLGGKFVLSGGEEEKLNTYKKQFGWIILGLLVVSVAEYAGYKVFDPTQGDLTPDGDSVNNFEKITGNIITFVQYIVGGVALIAGVRSGYALIMNGDDSEVVEKEKEFINIFLFALGLIIFAEAIKTWVDLTKTGGNAFETEKIVSEIVGLINFVLMFVAASALFSVVLSSGYYVISMGNDDLTSRAKKMIINSVIALIIAYSSYTIVSFLT